MRLKIAGTPKGTHEIWMWGIAGFRAASEVPSRRLSGLKSAGLQCLFFKFAEVYPSDFREIFPWEAGVLFLFALYWVSPGFDSHAYPTLHLRLPAQRAGGRGVLPRRNFGPVIFPDTESTSRFSPTGLPAAGILRDVYTSPSKRTTTVAPVWDTVNSEMSPF